nr:uracil-DNA glycosylase [Mariprofundus erugo]
MPGPERAPAAPPLSSLPPRPEVVAARPAVPDATPVGLPSSTCDADPVAPVVFKSLDEIAVSASGCRLCALAETRTQVVFGVGNPAADILFIGEAPGRDEDLQGEPFVGRAGQLLDRMLVSMGLDRDSVYIMNVVKCRPPNNRDPKPDEVQACQLWFDQQLDALQPKLICLLGRVAAQTVLQTDAPLGALRGRWHTFQGIPTLVTYHPAYLLRSPQQKQKSWADLCVLLNRYGEIAPR